MPPAPKRASIIVRCSREDAARIHERASAEHRSVSGYILYMLDRSIWIEDSLARGLTKSFLAAQASHIRGKISEAPRTSIHLRCSEEQADRIRRYSATRQLSISGFVIFSLRRSWDALDRLRRGSQD